MAGFRLELDDDVTTFDGRAGIVMGLDGSYVTVLPDGNGDRFRVTLADIATVNQQETRPRSGPMHPPAAWP